MLIGLGLVCIVWYYISWVGCDSCVSGLLCLVAGRVVSVWVLVWFILASCCIGI